MVATTAMTTNMTKNLAQFSNRLKTFFTQNDKKDYKNSVCTSLKTRHFFITQLTKFISSTLYY